MIRTALLFAAVALLAASAAAAQPRPERLPLPRPRHQARQRPEGHRRPHAVRGAGGLLDRRAHRLARRGRAGPHRLRPLLRAHDVPRHREVPGRRLRRDAHEDGRRRQRLHHRRPDRLPHRDRRRGPGDGDGDRDRPLQEPQLRRAGLQDRGRRGLRRVPQEPLEPLLHHLRGGAQGGLRRAHLQAHHDRLRGGHQGDARPCSTTRASSSTASTGRRTWCCSSPATSSPTPTLALVEQVLRRLEEGLQAPEVKPEPAQTEERKIEVAYEGQTLPDPLAGLQGRRPSTPPTASYVAASLLGELALRRDQRALQEAGARRAGRRVHRRRARTSTATPACSTS